MIPFLKCTRNSSRENLIGKHGNIEEAIMFDSKRISSLLYSS